MSISLSSVLNDARSLVTRLQDRDQVTDKLISNAQGLNERIGSMKQYKEELHQLSEVTQHRPRSHLVYSLQKENRQIKILEAENRQLRVSLEDHQAALELIMAKYRQHMMQFMMLKRNETFLLDQLKVLTTNPNDVDNYEKLREFAAIFSECLKQGEAQSSREQEELSQLKLENNALRELLKLAEQNDPGVRRTFTLKCRDIRDSLNKDDLTPVLDVSDISAMSSDADFEMSGRATVRRSEVLQQHKNDPDLPAPPATSDTSSDSVALQPANSVAAVTSSALDALQPDLTNGHLSDSFSSTDSDSSDSGGSVINGQADGDRSTPPKVNLTTSTPTPKKEVNPSSDKKKPAPSSQQKHPDENHNQKTATPKILLKANSVSGGGVSGKTSSTPNGPLSNSGTANGPVAPRRASNPTGTSTPTASKSTNSSRKSDSGIADKGGVKAAGTAVQMSKSAGSVPTGAANASSKKKSVSASIMRSASLSKTPTTSVASKT